VRGKKQHVESGRTRAGIYPSGRYWNRPIADGALERRGDHPLFLSGGFHARLHQPGLQSAESHAKFRQKYQLPFTLLSDEQKTVIKMYGLNGPLGIGVRRASYLVDGGRRVRDAVLADFRIGRHMDFVRKAVALRTTGPLSG
jgi:hypothetical protein